MKFYVLFIFVFLNIISLQAKLISSVDTINFGKVRYKQDILSQQIYIVNNDMIPIYLVDIFTWSKHIKIKGKIPSKEKPVILMPNDSLFLEISFGMDKDLDSDKFFSADINFYDTCNLLLEIPLQYDFIEPITWQSKTIHIDSINAGSIANGKFYFENTSDEVLRLKLSNWYNHKDYKDDIVVVLPHHSDSIEVKIQTDTNIVFYNRFIDVDVYSKKDKLYSTDINYTLPVQGIQHYAMIHFNTTTIAGKFKYSKEYETAKFVFPFTNTGNIPLIITRANTSSGGSMIYYYPKKSILPNEKDSIIIQYNLQRKGPFRKTGFVHSNTALEVPQILHIEGIVEE